MRVDTHANLVYMHHTARWFHTLERWAIVNQTQEPVAIVTVSAIKRSTVLVATLILGRHKLAPRAFTRPGGERTALRWVCQELNNGNLWLRARLLLEHEARLLGHSEPELLDCWHAYEYQYCQRLLANLPGLLDQERREETNERT